MAEVSADKLGNDSQTLLSHASWFGHEGVGKILLGQNKVISDKPDNGGRAPLSIPASYGCNIIAATLLLSGQAVIPGTVAAREAPPSQNHRHSSPFAVCYSQELSLSINLSS